MYKETLVARLQDLQVEQVLHLTNGSSINDRLAAKDNRIEKLMATNMDNARLLEELYLVALARAPSKAEKDGILKEFASAGNDAKQRRIVVEDVLWSILSSREFMFNH